jgi:hypothetical protein
VHSFAALGPGGVADSKRAPTKAHSAAPEQTQQNKHLLCMYCMCKVHCSSASHIFQGIVVCVATGDEPLYTQEVDCVPAPVIAAQARHTVLLQPGESVADCFAGEPGTSESLLFQVRTQCNMYVERTG